ncbi:myelin-oligodendrocyte glycoprotein-like [Notothenia coriiceps]|uniref:Myelin-oligodendrocyte glycoprotein-like n=1 Tax=Notothenia coriiceps TaxID=8208 RepID=A0A6I9P0N2_9TELE|nr:PREDICTED: myelin-oligodendrocyte glycoprotein-like [Notothenia coriiceps]
MIFLTPLLLFLASCVSGTFVVNVTQASYQAEENQNITLEWTFSTRRDTSLNSISIVCDLVSVRPYNLLHLYKGIELPESQDPEFAGRVQWDKDVLTEGRLTLHVSRLRTSDSGFYICKVFTDYGRNNGRCCLNVTAAEELEPQRPRESTTRESEKTLAYRCDNNSDSLYRQHGLHCFNKI